MLIAVSMRQERSVMSEYPRFISSPCRAAVDWATRYRIELRLELRLHMLRSLISSNNECSSSNFISGKVGDLSMLLSSSDAINIRFAGHGDLWSMQGMLLMMLALGYFSPRLTA